MINAFGRVLITGLLFFGAFDMATPAAPIVQLGNPVLREKAQPLSLDEIHSPKIQALIQTMRETLHGKGVGLAAPQIGFNLQIAVIEDLPEYIDKLPKAVRDERGRRAVPFHVLINPKITWMDQETALFFEGCLSVDSVARVVPRAKRIKVEFLNEQGEAQTVFAEGWYARILQHEIGHLRGVLLIDISDPRAEISMREYKEKWLYASQKEIQQFYAQQLNL